MRFLCILPTSMAQEEVLKLLSDLEQAQKDSDSPRIVDILKMLGKIKGVTTSVLSATRAGLAVAKLKKHAAEDVAKASSELVDQWKGLVKADVSTAASAGGPASPTAAAAAVGLTSPKAAGAAAATAIGASATSSTSTAKAMLGGAAPKERLAALEAALSAPMGTPSPTLAEALGYSYKPEQPFLSDRAEQFKRAASKEAGSRTGPVLYWMSRDQRVSDNWALLRAQQKALKEKRPLLVVFCLLPSYLGASLRAYGFMLRGLRQLEADLAALNIPFRLLLGKPEEQVAGYANAVKACSIVADFCPLRGPMAWKKGVAAALHPGCELEVVDAHNIVPVWTASNKLEVGARTIRRKIHDKVPGFCTEFPAVQKHPHAWPVEEQEGAMQFYTEAAEGGAGGAAGGAAGGSSSSSSAAAMAGDASLVRLAPRQAGSLTGLTDWGRTVGYLSPAMDAGVPEVTWCQPGERAAQKQMAVRRNKGERGGEVLLLPQSGACIGQPFLHHGLACSHTLSLFYSLFSSPLPLPFPLCSSPAALLLSQAQVL